jgi:hypothetical protein
LWKKERERERVEKECCVEDQKITCQAKGMRERHERGRHTHTNKHTHKEKRERNINVRESQKKR